MSPTREVNYRFNREHLAAQHIGARPTFVPR